MGFVVSEGSLAQTRNDLIGDGRPFGITSFRGLTQAYEVIYRSQPAIRTVVEYLAKNVASIGPPKLYERESSDKRVHRRDHPLDRLVRRPHPKKSAHAFYRDIVEDLGTFDNMVTLKARVEGQRQAGPFALVRLPPQRVDPIGGDLTTAGGFRILGDPRDPIPWENTVHIHGYNPADARWGLSPIETLRATLDEDIAARDAREGFWRRATQMSGWISRPADAPKWEDGVRRRFRQSWAEKWGPNGSEAGGTPVLEEGMEFHAEEFDAEALQYLEARKLTREECFEAYHTSPGLLRGQEGTDGAARRALYADTFGPLLDFIAGEMLVQLLPEFEAEEAFDRLYLEFDLKAKLAGHFLDQAEVISRSVGAPWMQRSEARSMFNLPPLDAAEGLVTPLNVTIGGRASPADTAPGTPGAGQVGQASRPRGRARNRNRTASRKDWVDLATKSVEDLPPELRAWSTHTAALVADLVDRQRDSFLSKLGAGQSVTDAFQASRWDEELGDLLVGVGLDVTDEQANALLTQFGAAGDPDIWALDVTQNWIDANARNAAGAYNASTLGDLTAADDDPEVDTDTRIGEVFGIAASSRAVSFGMSRTQTVAAFARSDASQALGLATKTWRTHSQSPRPSHAALNGVTIAADADFTVGSSSAPWPHHPALPSDEVGGCTCTVDFA